MRHSRTYGRYDALAHTSQDSLLARSADELANIGTNRYTSFCQQLYTVFCHRGNNGCVYHFRVYRHLHGIEDITSCKVDGGCHFERQFDIGFRCRHQSVNNLFDVSACEVVCLEVVAFDVEQTRFVCLYHSVHYDRSGHFTQTH